MKVTKEMLAELRAALAEFEPTPEVPVNPKALRALLDERKALRETLKHLQYKHDIDVDDGDAAMVLSALALGGDE